MRTRSALVRPALFLLPLAASIAGCGSSAPATASPQPALVAPLDAFTGHGTPMHGRCVVVDPSGSERTYVYEHQRLVASEHASMGVAFRYDYDAEGRLARVDATQEGVAAVEQRFDYDADGRLVARSTRGVAEGEERERWELAYDAEGRLSRATRHESDGSTLACTLAYDDRGLLVGYTCEPGGERYLPRESSRLTYDDAGRLVAIDSVQGDEPARRHELRYGPTGLLTEALLRDESGAVRASEEAVYDEGGRVSAVRSGGREARVSYDGDFGPGSSCGAAPPAPPGVPAFRLIRWFGLSD